MIIKGNKMIIKGIKYEKNYKPIWIFEKENGKWKAYVCGKFVYNMFSTYGFPMEMTIEEISNWSKETRLKSQLIDWVYLTHIGKIKILNQGGKTNDR